MRTWAFFRSSEERKRQARRKRIDLARRVTRWLVPSLPVLLVLAGIAAVIVANARVSAVP